MPRILFLASLVYVTISVTQSLLAPELWNTPLAPLNVVTAIALLVSGLVSRRRSIPVTWAHPLLAGGALVVLANCLLRIYWTATPVLSVVFFLIGVACIVRSTTWFLSLEGVALTSVIWVSVRVLPSEVWPGFVGLHAIGLANAALIYFVRARADRRARLLQSQLRDQNELLEIAATTAREAERRYQAALENASDVIFTMDAAGRPTYLNPVAKGVFPRSSWGEGFFFLNRVHTEHRDRVQAQLIRQLDEGHPSLAQELRLEDVGGRERWLEQIVRLVHEKDHAVGFHVVARDVSERKTTERDLLTREKILGAVAEVANLMIGQGEFLEALRAALPLLGEATRVSRVYAFRNSTDQSGRALTSQIAEWCDTGISTGGDDPALHGLPLAEFGFRDAETFLAASRGIWISSPDDEIPILLRRLLESRGVLTLAIVPILVDSELWGFLGFDDCVEQRRWSPGEVDTLRSVARIVGGALARRATEHELRRARDAAEAAMRAKSEFLANMSHEIRTPLSGVLGMADLVLSGPLEPVQRERMTSILSSGRSLLTIINDILDLSRIEAGRMELESRPFHPGEVIHDVLQLLRTSAEEKGLGFEAELASSLERLAVRGDAVRLRQILTNVLGNAVKFTAHGQVTIKADSDTTPSGDAVVRIHVVDSGIGIAETAQPRIFEPFEQGDASVTRRFGGTGLGLSITQSLVARMGGSISLSSQVGQGTEVSLSIPFHGASWQEPRVRVDDEPEKVAALGTEDSRHGPSLRALLAEDDAVSRHIASAFLETSGCQVDLAGNGLEAVEMATQSPYDVIFLDVQMPELDGFSAARAIRSGEVNRRTPIVALTALAMAGDRERCLAAGMSHYLSKPLDRQKLVEVLKNCRAATA